jgi:ABC-type amino acid transport substrate-binding protein
MLLPAIPLSGQDQGVIKVGVKHEPPFVIKVSGDEYSGFAVDLWEIITDDKGVEFRYIEYNDYLGLLRALDFGEIDISINPIHVNEVRVKMFEVTQPFFVSSIGVATTSKDRSQFNMIIRNFFSLQFLRMVLWLSLSIFIFGTILWMVERRYNRRQFDSGWVGLFDGLWWSAVTLTTVGYGDKAPKSKLGRVIAMLWMFLAVIIIAGFTGTVASTLTVRSLSTGIEQLDDLRSVQKIGCVYDSRSEDLLKKNDIQTYQLYDTPGQALRALADKEIDVVLHDKTVLGYLINQQQLDRKVTLLPVNFSKQNRSYFLPEDSPLIDWVNPLLVRAINETSWQEVMKKYESHEE